ncbi:MAG TPA: nuclear transport factor 2 family protein [Solirubrobacteraceae bacterium]|nr:nuclear transport factor 2 family protein [Solirubrobacteraceae bacterium]
MNLTAEDRLEILELVTIADNCATSRDVDAYVGLFTEDGTMSGAMGEAIGRDALRRTVSNVWAGEPAGTLHLTLNATIVDSDEEARVTSVMLMVTDDQPPRLLGWASVRQVVRRTAEGWRIASRAIQTPGAIAAPQRSGDERG